MATPNYGYEKRQRELAKKKKKEEKLLAKSQRKADDPAPDEGNASQQAPGDASSGSPEQGTGNSAA